MRRRTTTSAVALGVVAALAFSSCSSDPGPLRDPDLDYSSPRIAPLPGEVPEASRDEQPPADQALVELALEDGATAALWIDQDDYSKVLVQYSDPDDPRSWTEPQLVYQTGDGSPPEKGGFNAGCLFMNAAAAASTVAVGLGCYASDAFIQQFPDDTVAVVSSDFQTWDRERIGEEVIPLPEVSEDGSKVVFRNEEGVERPDVFSDEVRATWRRGSGF